MKNKKSFREKKNYDKLNNFLSKNLAIFFIHRNIYWVFAKIIPNLLPLFFFQILSLIFSCQKTPKYIHLKKIHLQLQTQLLFNIFSLSSIMELIAVSDKGTVSMSESG